MSSFIFVLYQPTVKTVWVRAALHSTMSKWKCYPYIIFLSNYSNQMIKLNPKVDFFSKNKRNFVETLSNVLRQVTMYKDLASLIIINHFLNHIKNQIGLSFIIESFFCSIIWFG